MPVVSVMRGRAAVLWTATIASRSYITRRTDRREPCGWANDERCSIRLWYQMSASELQSIAGVGILRCLVASDATSGNIITAHPPSRLPAINQPPQLDERFGGIQLGGPQRFGEDINALVSADSPVIARSRNEKGPHRCGPFCVWCRHQESNSGPTDYKSVALPAELYRLKDGRHYSHCSRRVNCLLAVTCMTFA